MIVSESIQTFNFINEERIAREILNEKFDINSVKSAARKAGILASLFVLFTVGKNPNAENRIPPRDKLVNSPIIQKMAGEANLDNSQIYRGFEEIYNKEIRQNRYKGDLRDPLTLTTSEEAKKFIKDHEKLRLSAYTLGDKIGGKIAITIGYGHAKPEDESKYKVGDKISRAEAERLFEEDLKRKEEGVKRIFKQWKDDGIEVQITQSMFDSMVSMAFNMGIGGLRKTDFIQDVKAGDFMAAAEKIPTERIGKKFSRGLQKRRTAEAELFTKDFV